MNNHRLVIRESPADEQPVRYNIQNRSNPSDMLTTVQDSLEWEELESRGGHVLRLLALLDGLPVAYATTSTLPFLPSQRFAVNVVVLPSWRRRGIARALYGRLVAFAQEHGANEISCMIHESIVPHLQEWLDRDGYRQVARTRQSELNLHNYDPECFRHAEEKVLDQGFSLVALASDDTEANRRRLWELHNLVERDVPWDTHGPSMQFERFVERVGLKECCVIACDSGRYIGFTNVRDDALGRAMVGMTGVHADYRGRGIAFALKARSHRLLKGLGYESVRTFNHVNNPAILSVNTRMGYVPMPERAFFVAEIQAIQSNVK
ncbi:MAG: GNAT family N-acetyltransferase [Chloroflexota bacterium]|nr:MAG: hypothetical protein DLM70_09635 [Chloroflexota bacterium]